MDSSSLQGWKSPQDMWATAWQNQQIDMCAQRTQISLGIRPVW